jgi:hypothetical protein
LAFGEVDVVWFGHGFAAEANSPSTGLREALERLPGGRSRTALIADDRGLRGTCPKGKATLRKTGGKPHLSH